MEDLIFKYNTKVTKLRSNISELNKIGFKLANEITLIDDVDSEVSKKINLLDDDTNKELLIQDVYAKALDELDKIELKQYNYYKFYSDCESIIKMLRNVDFKNIDEIIEKAMSLLEAIREGLIIVSDKDRYLLDKVFKTIYEVLKVSFLYGKGKKLYDEINKVDVIKPHIRDYIKEDMKKLEKTNRAKELKEIVREESPKKDELGMNLIAAIAVFESTKIKDKKAKVHEIAVENHKELEKNVNMNEKKLEEKKLEETKKNDKDTKTIDIGLVAADILSKGDAKFDKEESSKKVEGDEKIVIPVPEQEELIDDDNFFEETYLDEIDNEESQIDLFYDEDEINEFNTELMMSEEKIPAKLKQEIKNNKEFSSNWFSLLPLIIKSGELVGKAMLFAVLGEKKAKEVIKHIQKYNLFKENEDAKKKVLEMNDKRL